MFCDSSSPRLSLFFLKKKAFKAFVKESNQDLYSSKLLLDKAFDFRLESDFSTFCSSHLFFCSSLTLKHSAKLNFTYCIHCGMIDCFNF